MTKTVGRTNLGGATRTIVHSRATSEIQCKEADLKLQLADVLSQSQSQSGELPSGESCRRRVLAALIGSSRDFCTSVSTRLAAGGSIKGC